MPSNAERVRTRRGYIYILAPDSPSDVWIWRATDLGRVNVISTGEAGSRAYAITDGYVALVRAGTPMF